MTRRLIAFFLAAQCLAALPARSDAPRRPWPLDGVPAAWTNISIDWKASWDETLAAHDDAKAFRQIPLPDHDPDKARELDPSGWITVWEITDPYTAPGQSSTELFDTVFEPERTQAVLWRTAIGTGPTPWRTQFQTTVRNNRVAYMRAKVWSPKDREVRLEIGSNDGFKAWVNNELVGSNNVMRNLTDRQEIAPARLKAGWNLLMLKVTQQGGGWEASVCVRARDGGAAGGLRLASAGMTEETLRIRHIVLLEAMMRHFPAARDKHPQACADIAADFECINDRTRAIQWAARLIEDFPDRKDRVASACQLILRNSHPFDCIPDSDAWITYASGKVLELETTSPASLDAETLDLARRRPCMAMVQNQRFVEARRFLDSLRDRCGSASWWRTERASLMNAVGDFRRAAELYAAAGHRELASNLLAQADWNPGDDPASRPSHELTMRWNTLQQIAGTPGSVSGTDPAHVQELITLAADSWAMRETPPGSREQFWVAVDRVLLGANAADLQPLREFEERKAVAVAAELERTDDPEGLVSLFRRYPFAHRVHETLLSYGERALRLGHNGRALRCFRDALTHSTNQAVRARATVGLWLSLAQEPDAAGELSAALARVPDPEPLPWRGGTAPAADVKNSVRASLPPVPAPSPDPAALKRRRFVLPRDVAENDPGTYHRLLAPWRLGPWAIDRIETSGDGLALIGRQSVVCFTNGSPAARWFNAPARLSGQPRGELSAGRDAPAPGAAGRPVSIGDRRCSGVAAYGRPLSGAASGYAVFALVSVPGADGSVTHHVAAFNVTTGRTLWDTRTRPEWNDLRPMNSPAAGDGRLYILALGQQTWHRLPVHLVCADAEDGAIQWNRRIGFLPLSESTAQELMLAGNPVTLHQGAVYVSTDGGMVGRFDARDGMAEWIRPYPGSARDNAIGQKFRREGTSPLVAGDRVIVAPRDYCGAMAFDCATGNLVWESPLVPSDQICGIAGNVVVATAGREIAGIDSGSGRELWHRAPDEDSDVQAVVAGRDVLAVAGDRIVRITPATGAVSATGTVERAAGAEVVLLNDASLVEIAEEQTSAPEAAPPAAGPLRPPLAETWRLACDAPELIAPAPGNGPRDSLGVWSGRSVLCVRTQPRFELAWQRRLRERPDSIGFQGNRVIAAGDRTLTALDAGSGSTKWTAQLSFRIDAVCGNDQALFAANLGLDGKVAAVSPSSGAVLWQRWFDRELAYAGKALKWISVRTNDTGASWLRLYWSHSPAGALECRMIETRIDAGSGLVRAVDPFLPSESEWPPWIAFGDDRRHTARDLGVQPWPRLGPFLPDAVAYIGKGSTARAARIDTFADLSPGWAPVMDTRPESQYRQAVGLHPTPAGLFIRRVGLLEYADPSTNIVRQCELPRNRAGRTAYDILDFRPQEDSVLVLAGTRSPDPDETSNSRYTWKGLQACNGMGAVSLNCFMGQVQLGHITRQFPEAGANPVATLLNGAVKQHYQPSRVKMSGLSSLGWSRYNVFFYGFIGTATIEGGPTNICAGADYGKAETRTTFLRGTNYMKFAGLSGDAFTLNFSQGDFSAIQVVNASPGAAPNKPEGIGIRWTGGGPVLRPEDVVGAEGAHGNWYNITPFLVLCGGPPPRAQGVANFYLDLFNRQSGQLVESVPLPVAPAVAGPAHETAQARFLDNAIITADPQGLRVFRSAAR